MLERNRAGTELSFETRSCAYELISSFNDSGGLKLRNGESLSVSFLGE